MPITAIKILCTGTYYETLGNGTVALALDPVTRYVPMELHQLALVNLKPNCSYKCLIESDGIGAGRPCHFNTSGQNVNAAAAVNGAAKLSQFRAGYKHMAGSILLGGVLPMVAIGSCVGAIVLARKYQNFKNRRQQMRKYQRLHG